MSHEARKAQNEVWFRELNERLEARALERSSAEFEIVCECAREECTERIQIIYGIYEGVRENATRFILVPGHIDPELERVVSSTDGYEVVEKLGLAAAVADAEDPRS